VTLANRFSVDGRLIGEGATECTNRERTRGSRATLSADEILALRELQLNYPYNSPNRLIPQFGGNYFELINHARFPVARADTCDKWNCKAISPENFFQVLDRDRLAEPGF